MRISDILALIILGLIFLIFYAIFIMIEVKMFI